VTVGMVAAALGRAGLAVVVILNWSETVSPQTPVGMINDNIKIVSHDTYPGLSTVEQAALDFAVMKQKMFAFATPSKC
jgi:hypothetical protein